MTKSPVFKVGIGVAVCVAVFIAILICGIYIDYMEYLEIGSQYTSIFWVDFFANLLTFVVSFLIFFVLILVNFYIIKKNLFSIDNYFENLNALNKNLITVILGILLAAGLSLFSSNRISDTIMPFLNSVPFGRTDPIFYQDIGYYVFQRPFYISVTNTFSSFTGFMIFSTAVFYLFFYGKFDFYNLKNIMKEKGIITHEISLIMIYFMTKAVAYKFAREDILFGTSNGFIGADYVDMNVWLNFYNVAPFILIAVVVATTIVILNKKIKIALFTVMIYPVLFIIVSVVASVVNLTVVQPNEMAVQRNYIQYNIDSTRSAYGLNTALEYEYEIKHDLNEEKIKNNLGTINNIRINDFDQTVNILNQLQSLKTYYTFTDTDVVTYTLDGNPTAVSIAAREINTEKLEESAKTYVNTKMRYTHGMGVVINKMNTINELGQPDFIVKDIPVTSQYEELNVTEPRIYYGETSNDYVIVGTKDGESDDQYTGGYYYQGNSGIGLNFFNRLILAVRETDFNLLISDQITGNSKILLNTNILDRAKKVAPFLKYDSDPTIVVDDDGSLKWIIDAYTTTGYYPYSQYTDDYNYIRNSVKVIIDAYHGTTKFYIVDKNDPVIMSYSRIYPDLFEKTDLPESLKEHVRYPMDIFNVQATMIQKYHIDNASDFYQKKGVWAFANEKTAENVTQPVKPYYNYMSVEEGNTELVLMIPYTLSNKDNMIAWVAMRCTGENYGQMIVYNFSQSENISGPYQVENRIDSDANISKDISLWESSGSSVIRGNLLVVPVENNLLYVEPIYITSGVDGSSLPQIARIVMTYNDVVVSETSVEKCLEKLFGYTKPVPETEGEESLKDLNDYISEALESYNNVKKHSQEGDWEGFGKYMNELDNDMSNLENMINSNNGESIQQ